VVWDNDDNKPKRIYMVHNDDNMASHQIFIFYLYSAK